jgi:autotransporter-associated beta strand protein
MAGRRSSARHETITSKTVTTVELNTQLQPEIETMKTPRHAPSMKKLGSLVLASSLLAAVLLTSAAHAQSGTWINPNGGSWANAANWQGGVIAQGADNTADFSTLRLSADATVTLDGAQTIGKLIFGDQSGAHNWILNTGSGGPLTLSVSANSPTITVSNQTATIGLALIGTEGLTQNGNGTLVLIQPVGYDGGTTNDAGALELLGSLDTSNGAPLVINAGYVESAATLYLDVDVNDSSGSTNVLGEGTLRLIATTNGSSSPDLYFGPDAYENYYYGAAINMSTLDLGASQRYIFANTEHNSVAHYDPWEDARINGNIIGAGGITYIAQNSYGGGNPMECPLVLAGANTFAGELEIQRGSIYLFNAQALVQTNKLLMDPVAGNNARLFLYGNGATIANLESGGSGNALIANGNAHNPLAIAPATLTINQTSNTLFGGLLVNGYAEYDNGSITPGPLSLVINGPGTLTLSGANTYSGSTTINSGGLVISTLQTGGGSFSLADGAALGINVVSANTLPMSSLTLGNSASSTVNFTFSINPSASVAAVTAASLTANGGSNAVTINISINGGVAAGQFPLIQYPAGSIGGTGFSAFKLGVVPSYLSAALVNNTANNSIDLKVTAVAEPEWSGLLSSEWSTNRLASPKNWVFVTDGKTPTDYADGNSVLFNDVATGTTTVNVNVADVAPASVTFNNDAKNYTLTGSKAIAGATGLVKTGSGSLAIQNINSFTGPVSISGGTVSINADGNLGAIPAAPTPGSVVLNGATLSAAATATLAANRRLALGPESGSGSGTLDVANGAILTVTAPLANNGSSTASLNKTGAGQLILAATPTYTGGTSNNAGTLTLLQSQSFASGSVLGIASNSIVQSAGTLSLVANESDTAVDVAGAGVLRLISTGNSPNSPDIYFDSNDIQNQNNTDNYGARIACAVDLGGAQRFIWGNTDHNGVGEYGLTAADCQFAGPISGAGGLTFIAQDSFTGSPPMEVGFCLNAPNSFTGPMEIQRGSIYLGNSNAFPAGDVLRFNLASTNNGRFFLYGNDVTASDLEATNTGTAVIADGNVIPDLVGPATLTIVQNNSATFNGTLQDVQAEYGGGGLLTPTLSLVKSGSATLTLAGDNTYSGPTTISAGTLALGSGGSLDDTPSITITPGAVLDVTASSFTLGEVVPQTLVAGRAGNFGTDVNGSLTSMSTVNVAGSGIAGTLTINGNLTLQGGNLIMDLAGANTKGAGVNDFISVSGALNLNGSTTITPNFLTGGLGAGPYTLIQAASLNGSPNNLTLVYPSGGRQSYTLDTTTTPGSVLLQVGGSPPAALVWLGTNSSTWNTTVVNWLNGAVADKFYNGDSVTFNDTATNGFVSLSGSVQPFSVAVTNNNTRYVFEGGGSLDGPASLTKSGRGTLLIVNSNSYSGLTLVAGGTLQVDTNSTNGTLGFGPVSNNATLIFDRSDVVNFTNAISGAGALEQAGSGTLVLLGTNNYSGPTVISAGMLQVGNDGTFGALGTGPVTNNTALILDRSDTLILGNAIAGAGLITNLDGTAFLTGASTYSGGTYIEGGMLVAANATALGNGNVFIDTGALYFDFPTGTTNTVANNINLPGTGTQEFLLEGNPTNFTTVRLTGAISGGSQGQTYWLADTGVTGNHYDVIELANPSNSFSANIGLYRGSIGFTSDAALGNAANSIEIDLWNTNGALRFDADNITLNSSRVITLDSGGVEPINVQSFTATIPGDITGPGTFVKLGSGTLILPGSYDYSGTTTIQTGTLMVNGLVESTAMMEVTNMATLDGVGTVAGPVTVDGTVAPGTNSVGTLTTGGELWNPGGSMVFSLNNATNSAGWSLLNITAGLDLEATSAKPFTIKLVSLTSSNTPGLITGFNPATSYTWTIANAASGITNFEASDFMVDASAFFNPFAGPVGGAFHLAKNGNSLVLTYTVTPQPLAFSGIQRLANGTFNLSLTGTIGTGFTVHASTNLALTPLSAWTVLGTGTIEAGLTSFDDLTSTNYPHRFYLISSP